MMQFTKHSAVFEGNANNVKKQIKMKNEMKDDAGRRRRGHDCTFSTDAEGPDKFDEAVTIHTTTAPSNVHTTCSRPLKMKSLPRKSGGEATHA